MLLRLCTRVRGTRLGQSVTAVLDSSLQRMRRIILDDFGNAAHIFLSLFPSRISYKRCCNGIQREGVGGKLIFRTELQSAVCSLRGQTPAVRDRKNARVPALLTHIPRREFRPSSILSRPTTITEIEDVRLLVCSRPIVEIYIIIGTYIACIRIFELIRDNGVR